MDSIKDIIPDVIQSISQQSPQQDLKIQRLWDNVVNDQQTKVVGFQEGVLHIEVDHNKRAYKLKMGARKILKQLQEDMPEIKQIVFRIGK